MSRTTASCADTAFETQREAEEAKEAVWQDVHDLALDLADLLAGLPQVRRWVLHDIEAGQRQNTRADFAAFVGHTSYGSDVMFSIISVVPGQDVPTI